MDSALKPGDLIEGRFRVEREDDEAIYAVDLSDDAPVLVRHAVWRNYGDEYVERALTETVARVVASLAHPSIARVRMSAPRVVIDAPPEEIVLRPDPEDMAACALLALDAIAALHAAGVPGVALDPCNARFCRRDGRWSLTLVHPPIASRRIYRWSDALNTSVAPESALVDDLRSIASLLDRHNNDALTTPGFLRPLVGSSAVGADDEHPMLRRFRGPQPPKHVGIAHEGLEAIHAMLRSASPSPERDGSSGPSTPTFPRSARELAEAILPFAPRDRAWSDLVAAMPHVTKVSLVRDWDTLIAHGEKARAEHPEPPRPARDSLVDAARDGASEAEDDDGRGYALHRYVACPLAAAYHARACAAFARGDRARARPDVDRAIALDPTVAYVTTRGRSRRGPRAGRPSRRAGNRGSSARGRETRRTSGTSC